MLKAALKKAWMKEMKQLWIVNKGCCERDWRDSQFWYQWMALSHFMLTEQDGNVTQVFSPQITVAAFPWTPRITQNLDMAIENWPWKLGKPLKYGWTVLTFSWCGFPDVSVKMIIAIVSWKHAFARQWTCCTGSEFLENLQKKKNTVMETWLLFHFTSG